ncbi:hypothetical protein [Mesorhizobium sp. M0228]|uniref:hypothetical protein n=1 Tax=Mesorhizobium sp. M0228 TaxID=2956923 RepID=UPI00333AB270
MPEGIRASVLLWPLRRCQPWHIAPQAGEARALVRISARRVKIAFSSACAVHPKMAAGRGAGRLG